MARKLQDQIEVGESELAVYPADELNIGINATTGEMAIELETKGAKGYSLYVAADLPRAEQIRDHIISLIEIMRSKNA